MKLRKACLLVLLLALAQLLAVASAGGPDADSNKEEAIEEDEEEEEEEEEEEDDLEVKEENGVLVLTDVNFDNFVADKDTVLLEFYAPWCGHCKQFAPEYEKIASTLKENDPPIPVAKIDATSESALASRFDVSGYPTIKILKKGQAVDYEGSRTQDEIIAKVKEISQPNWTPPPEVTLVLTKDNFDEVVNDADIILVEFYAPWCGHCKKLAPEYEKAAILDEGGRKFAMEPDEFDSDTLREFVTAFKKGKLKPVIKSQPVPKNNKGPVKVVVGKTFDSIVMDPKKDVLIEFYAPWCGHCKQLEPVYTALGKKYKGHKNLVVAKMDATANDITNDRYKVEGFPTIYFAPSGDKKNPIKFEDGNRDLEHLSKFVEEHATKPRRTREDL
uniref:protein disulfide-isomerase n=1 Tax=Myotis myotis TaxID=51298 RepID=A0A7J7V466_MYOMY|nr:protein disulfide isomerase family A member 4 [Myotis myotis]